MSHRLGVDIGGGFTRITRLARPAARTSMTLFLVAAASAARGQGAPDPAVLARQVVDAINSRSPDQRRALLHPKTLACAAAASNGFFDDLIARQNRLQVPPNYRSRLTPLAVDQAPLFADKFDYPLRPTHLLEIDFETEPNRSVGLVLQVVREADRWYEVTACPTAATTAAAQRATLARTERAARVEALVAGISPGLRDAVLGLYREGRRIDAIMRYQSASGEDLATVKDVVERLAAAAPARLFEARSDASGGATMDIVVREVERRPRASVLEIEIRAVGSSVGSSFLLLCSIRKLAQERGGYRFVVKAEDYPRRGQMLVGFLNSAEEPPANADATFQDVAGPAQVVALEQFAPICDAMK